MTPAQGRRIALQGTVQGVGFRPWVFRLATEAELVGRVSNGSEGVVVEAFGEPEALDCLVAQLRNGGPRAAHVTHLSWTPLPGPAPHDFKIVPSHRGGRSVPAIPPDLATCDECLAEVLDPDDRRFGYAFTNCTQCGPRLTIARGVPYDRPATSMAPFEMCVACRREYEDPTNRRFHAQPNACPKCGPHLMLLASDRNALPFDALVNSDPNPALPDFGGALELAARLLRGGAIMAIKGLGGYHLACDATSPDIVRELRRRKRRDQKPFAVMVRDLPAARRLARLSPVHERVLQGPERPILLAPMRPGVLAREVTPDTDWVGLMLPYTPLHHLLLASVGGPLVMTSGNLSGEPIVFDDEDAFQRLSGVADAFLCHDREIVVPAEESVATVSRCQPMLIRRARGYVPRAISVPVPFAAPVLGTGGHLKSAVAIGVDGAAWLGPHTGDLDCPEAEDAYRFALRHMLRLLRVRPAVVGHDNHPEYLSTRIARTLGARCVAVQHHHAHVVATMTEHGHRGPVLGLAWDGTGLGDDGSSWGGELLLATRASYQRLGTLRPIQLPGGEAAIHQPWRSAVALLSDAFDGALPALPFLDSLDPTQLGGVVDLLSADVCCPRAHGVGRYFDAVGAMLLGRHRAHYEGQVAMALEREAGAVRADPYPFDVDPRRAMWTVDLRPTVRALVDEMQRGVRSPIIAARFHQTLISVARKLIAMAIVRHGTHPIVLSGGCFQNVRLSEGITAATLPLGPVLSAREVPPGDGGVVPRAGRGGQRDRRQGGLNDVPWGCGPYRKRRRHGGSGRLLGRPTRRPPGRGGRAGVPRRLRDEPRGLRDPPHPAG